ncbi:MAG: T9SS type A sorting domain-containing protein [Cyclobacteriaceae bacterium]|nr:T9SS type A sorting domain-containing protein [Cyclobacteriaceae bacterium]
MSPNQANPSRFFTVKRSYNFLKYSLTFLLLSAGIIEAVSQHVVTSAAITASGNFTVPAGITNVTVECWGGGGGGGGVNGSGSENRGGGGGGGGGYTKTTNVVVAPGNVGVTIGDGGTVGSNASGGNGGTTTFSSAIPVSADGGGGGVRGTSGASSGAGGTRGVGVTFNGGFGLTAPGTATNATAGGGGGGSATALAVGNPTSASASSTGGTGEGNGANGNTGGGNGSTGNAPGGGGSGGYSDTNTDRSGGVGAKGQVIVTYTQPTGAITYDDPDALVKVGQSLLITATFSEAIKDAPPAMQISLSGANTLALTNMNKISSTVYTYTHTVGAGSGAVNITFGTGQSQAGNIVFGTPSSGGSFTIDSTLPTVSAHSVSNITTNSFDFNITVSNEAATTYYEVTSSASAPTAAQIKAGTGTGHLSLGNFPVAMNVSTPVTIGSLTPGTYYIYSVSEDIVTNQSTPVTSDMAVITCVAPTMQAATAATPFPAAQLKSNSLKYDWTNGDGTGGVIVIARQGSAVSFAPVSGNAYAGQINSDFSLAANQGSGNKIVYRGNAATVTLSNLTASTAYHFAVYAYNTASDCYMLTSPLVQNVSTIAIANEATISTGGGTATIASTIITQGAEANIFTFQIADAGADGVPTRISQMVFKPGAGNFFGNFTHLIAGAELYDNIPNGPAGTVTIAAGTITIATIPNAAGQLGEVPDGGSKTYTLKIWLNAPLNTAIRATADNKNLVLSLIHTDVTTAGTGSGMVSSNANSGSSNGAIDVTPTRLVFVQQPSNSTVGVAMTPAVTVEAADLQGTRDLNTTSSIGITSTGTLSSSPQNATFVAGLGTYSGIILTAPGTGLTLTTNSGTLSNPTSSTFSASLSNLSNIIEDAGFTYTSNVLYDTYQEGVNLTPANSFLAAGFTIQDLDGAGGDVVGTTLSTLTLDLGSNFNFIRRIAIYDATGTTEIGTEQTVSSATVLFSGLNALATTDGGTLGFTIRVSFKTTVTDNQQFSFLITGATTAAGSSQFAAGNASGASSSTSGNRNRIEINASKFLFITQPSTTDVNVVMSPSPTMQAVDGLNNRDLDFVSSVDLYSTGTLASSPQSATFVAGVGTYTNIVHSAAGGNLELFTISGFTEALSSFFQINAASSTITAQLPPTFFYPTFIQYENFQEPTDLTTGNSIVVARFDVRDGGGSADGDLFPTTLTSLTLDLGANFGYIRRIALYNGAAEVSGTDQNVSSSTVVFSGLSLVAPDDGTFVLTVRVSFTANVLDHGQFSLHVQAASAQNTGSKFSSAAGGGAGTTTPTGSSENTIDVNANRFRIVQQPPASVLLGVAMSPSITVEAADVLNNRDVDWATGIVSLLSTGSLASAQSATFSGLGVATFPNVIHNNTGTGLQLSTSNIYAMPNTSSNLFAVNVSNLSTIIENTSFVYPQNILYAGIQEAVDLTSANSALVARFDIVDGPDADGAATTLTGVTLDLGSNFTAIRRIALYNSAGTVELAEQAVSLQTVNFTGLSITTLDGGAANSFTVRVSFRTTVTDNSQLTFTISNATVATLTSSQFINASAGSAVTSTASDNNRIEVNATRLAFTTNPGTPLLPNIDIEDQSPVPVIKALDANGNTDGDYVTNVTLASAVTISPSNTLTVDNPSPNGGVYTFPVNPPAPASFRYTQTGTGTLTATSGALTSTSSSFVSVQAGLATSITNGVAAPATISSLTTLPGSQATVFNFNINDDPIGTAVANNDGLPTLINALYITQFGGSNTITNWADAIAGATLQDGLGHSIASTSITSSYIEFLGIPTAINTLGYVPDNGTQAYTLKIHLKAPMTGTLPPSVDGLRFGFEVIYYNIVLSANSTGILSQQVNSGTNNTVDVVATKLNYISPTGPTSASLNTNYPNVSIEATDVNGNRDLNYIQPVRYFVAGSGVSTINGPVVNTTPFISGVLDLATNFQFTSGVNAQDVSLHVRAGAGPGTTCGVNGIICATGDVSPTITLLSSFESSIIGDPTFTPNSTLNYINFQTSDIQNTTTSLEISRMLLVDGSKVLAPYFASVVSTGTNNDGQPNSDVDGAATALTSITIRVTNPSNLRRIALYSNGVELSEQNVTAIGAITDATAFYDFVFTGSPLLVAPDNSIVPLSIRVSFRDETPSATAVRDHDPINVRIMDAVLSNGSSFYPNPPDVNYIAGVFGGYQAAAGTVNVIATQLDFITQPPAYAGVSQPVAAGVVHARDVNGLLDLDYNAPAFMGAGSVGISGTFNVVNGILNLSTLQYQNAGLGTLTASSGALTPGVSSAVEVLDVTTLIATGGVITSTNLVGNSTDKVIFGFTFNVPYTAGTEPKLNGFTISFNNPVSTPITSVFSDFRIYESTSTSFSTATAQNVEGTIGATVTSPAPFQSIQVVFPTPRDIATQSLTYFLEVDIDPTASGSTPTIQPSIVDGGFGSGSDTNIITSNGSATSSTFGQSYTFASIFPPILTNSNPAKAQLNVNINQSSIDLYFSVPVWTLDGYVKLYNYATGAFIADCPLILPLGKYDNGGGPGSGPTANPIRFQIPPAVLPLAYNTFYYITIPTGNFSALTGIMDAANNVFQGFSNPGSLYFRTTTQTPPVLLNANSPTPVPNPTIGGASLSGALISATFDQKGTAFFMVVNSGNPQPTNDMINGTDLSYTGTVRSRGSFAITQTNPISQTGVITPTGGSWPAGNYDVWMYAQNDGLPTPYATAAPYGSSSFNFLVVGTTPPLPLVGPVTGPTLTFTAAAVTTVTLNKPDIKVCNNSYQVLNVPLTITEGTATQFYAGTTLQTMNIVLPAGFQFDVSKTGSVPTYGTLQLIGSDFQAGSGTLDFFGNSILTVSYINRNFTSRDRIVISGLRVIATSSSSGSFRRLGGNALTSFIPDGTTMGTLTSSDAVAVGFTNSYHKSLASPPANTVTSIPDNFNSPSLAVQLTPTTSSGGDLFAAGDFGPSTFIGQGVSVTTLNLGSVTKDAPFNITISHTDNNGCISNNPVQYTVYDHTTGINISNAAPAIPPGALPPPPPAITLIKSPFCVDGSIRHVVVNNVAGYYMRDPAVAANNLRADLPQSVIDNPGTQVISGTDWQNLIKTLPVPHPFVVGSTTFYNYTFDDATILNAHTINSAIPDPTLVFRKGPTAQGNFYNDGGLLGSVEFTGTYQSTTNSTVVFPRKQLVEFFIAPAPLVEVDRINESKPSSVQPVPIYCEAGGIVKFNGFPAALAGTSVGTFSAVDAVSGVPITGGGFIDNSNGTATLDPSLSKNGYANIRVVYNYKLNISPCSGTSSITIRIAPNPVGNFVKFVTNTADPQTPNPTSFCVGKQITFDAANGALPFRSTISSGVIDSVKWDFGDITSGTNRQRIAFGPASALNYTYNTFGPKAVTMSVLSSLGCASTPVTQIFGVGGIPVVKFKMDGVSTNDVFRFNSNETSTAFGASSPFTPVGNLPADDTDIVGLASDVIAKYDWDFGDASPIVSRTGLANDAAYNANVVTHTYSSIGRKDINLTVTSLIGCVNSLALQNSYRSIVVLPRQSLVVVPPATTGVLVEDFEGPSGQQWQVWGTGTTIPLMKQGLSSATWEYGPYYSGIAVPDDTDISKVNIWKTNLTGPLTTLPDGITQVRTYKAGEKSALYSPSFDLSSLTRSMISFNSVVQTEQSDGVVLEYSTDDLNIADPNKKWWALGQIDDGEDWFTDQGIAGRPGTQGSNDFGWSGPEIKKWQAPKHVLDAIFKDPVTNASIIPNKTVFRWAIGSAASGIGVQGFALDNVRIGDRTRTILLESFTSASNSNPTAEEKIQNGKIADFISTSIGTEVVKINYHLGFPAKDPFNEDNPGDPSSRALLYNITATPKSLLDGEKDDLDRKFEDWVPNLYQKRTLQLAQADVEITTSTLADNQIQIDAKITATVLTGIPASTILHVAILEQTVPAASLSSTQQAMIKSGETSFEYVMKRMLPSAAGTRFGTPLPNTVARTFSFVWTPELKKLYAPTGDLAIAVFLQQEERPHEIYQVEIKRNLSEPAVVTGLEPAFAEKITFFPVPANHELNILLPGVLAQDAPLQMIDQMGKVIQLSSIPGGSSQKVINTSDLAAGVYILQIEVGKENFVRKKVMVIH